MRKLEAQEVDEGGKEEGKMILRLLPENVLAEFDKDEAKHLINRIVNKAILIWIVIFSKGPVIGFVYDCGNVPKEYTLRTFREKGLDVRCDE